VDDPSFQTAVVAELPPTPEIAKVTDQGNTSLSKSCPHCAGTELYNRRISSAGDGIYLLEGLGSFLHHAEFDVVVCAACGLTRFFAEPDARQNLRSNKRWKRL
jgi:predicted nucleic-acid-binding Zn-ribbon protein